MSERSRPTRRTVLRTCGALCLGAGGTTAASARESDSTTVQSDEQTTVRTGAYAGTVDRIVDGEHVVVLLAEDGEEVAQKVLARERAPHVDEGDYVHLWLWRGSVFGIWPD